MRSFAIDEHRSPALAFERSKHDVLEEVEIFKGAENSVIMEQTYTHKFQCLFQLERYPFDTQVFIHKKNIGVNTIYFRSAPLIWRLLV